MILIDYEYSDWNPLAFDVSNILNEFTVDNAASFGPFNSGIQFYESNFPERSEMKFLATEYFTHYFELIKNEVGIDFDKWFEEKFPVFMMDVEKCCILANFYWANWSIMMMKEEEECDHTIFNWELCRQHCILFTKQREWFGHNSL